MEEAKEQGLSDLVSAYSVAIELVRVERAFRLSPHNAKDQEERMERVFQALHSCGGHYFYKHKTVMPLYELLYCLCPLYFREEGGLLGERMFKCAANNVKVVSFDF
ncbi:MAG: hypothetical protein P4L69_13490 [Desulfosporosinus sp.]|nr:hypothetical protein [Desulfosporosinus sp.]